MNDDNTTFPCTREYYRTDGVLLLYYLGIRVILLIFLIFFPGTFFTKNNEDWADVMPVPFISWADKLYRDNTFFVR